MKTKSVFIALFIGLLLPFVAIATENALNYEVPKYDQALFNNPIPNTSVNGTEDCVPTSVGMVFGYFYRKFQFSGNFNLIPVLDYPFAPIDPNGNLADWSNNQYGIKRLIEYQECEIYDTCQGAPYSLSEYFGYCYNALLCGFVGTNSADLCHKIRQSFSDYDSNFSLTVSYDSINTNVNNKDEIVARIKSEIDNDNPVMFYAVPGLSFYSIAANQPTPDSTAGFTQETPNSFGHAMVITGYNGNIFRLNFGYASPAEVIIDASNNFGYPSNKGTCALVFFFTMGETPGVGFYPNNEWRYGDAGGSQNFINAFVKFGGASSIGQVSTEVYSLDSGEELIYVQEFINSSALDVFLISSEQNDWYYTFPLHGQILNFWLAYSGYFLYGAPMEAEHNEVDSNGLAIVVQKFQKGENVSYIGYCSEGAWLGEYTYENGEYVQVIVAPQIKNIISMKSVPDLICEGIDAFAYLGFNPTTEQPVVSIINPLNGAETGNIVFLNSNARPKFITILPDMNGNGYSEIHVTAYNVTNLGKLIEIRDSLTGAIIQ